MTTWLWIHRLWPHRHTIPPRPDGRLRDGDMIPVPGYPNWRELLRGGR